MSASSRPSSAAPSSPRARRARLARLALALTAALAFTGALVAPSEARAESAAEAKNTGFKLGMGPVILLPTDGGPLGGGLELGARYGIPAGPIIVAPGARLAGYLISQRFVGLAMPTLRVTLPIGPLAPFVVGGIGGGWLGNPSEAGLGAMAGGGLMIHFGRIIAVGVEATYQTVTDTEFRALAIGPAISLF